MLKIDLHIHTIASSDAHNTMLEYVNMAKKLKMKIIGISNHGPQNDVTLVNEFHFNSLRNVPKKLNGIRVLKGIEANIINTSGNIDISNKIIDRLDYVMANIHENAVYIDKGKSGNTRAIINAIESGKVDIISHAFVTHKFDFDVRAISEAACKNDVLLEVDINYVREHKLKPNTISDLKTIIETCRKYKKKVIVGSDAHDIWHLADDAPLKKIKKKIGLTDDMIINNYPKELFEFLKINE